MSMILHGLTILANRETSEFGETHSFLVLDATKPRGAIYTA